MNARLKIAASQQNRRKLAGEAIIFACPCGKCLDHRRTRLIWQRHVCDETIKMQRISARISQIASESSQVRRCAAALAGVPAMHGSPGVPLAQTAIVNFARARPVRRCLPRSRGGRMCPILCKRERGFAGPARLYKSCPSAPKSQSARERGVGTLNDPPQGNFCALASE